MIGRFETFTYAITEISKYWNKIAVEEMKVYELKGAYAIYLVSLNRFPDGITSAQLCEICSKDKAEISRAVSLMEQRGLIIREHKGDNMYRALIKLTEKGKTAAAQIRERAQKAVEAGGRGVSKEDRETFYNVLGTISENLKKISKEGLK